MTTVCSSWGNVCRLIGVSFNGVFNENYSQHLEKRKRKSNLNHSGYTLVFSISNAYLCIILFGQLLEMAVRDAVNPHRRFQHVCLSVQALKIAFLKPSWDLHLLIRFLEIKPDRIYDHESYIFKSIWLLAHVLQSFHLLSTLSQCANPFSVTVRRPHVLSILLWPVQDSAPRRFVCHTQSHQHFSRSYSIESCGNCPWWGQISSLGQLIEPLMRQRHGFLLCEL